MQRRTFLTSSLAAAALSTAAVANSQSSQSASNAKGRLYYELRRYQLSSGPQKKLCDDFFQLSLIHI